MKKYHVLFFSLVFLMAIFCFFPFRGQKAPPKSKESILREMIGTYSRNKDLSETAPFLESLTQLDAQSAGKWEEIMRYWDFANTEMALNEVPPEDLENADPLCTIVLGYQLNADGSMQKELLGRLEKALLCAEKYPDSYILCTGGGTAAKNTQATEAQAMADWLMENGVAADRILIEAASMTTTENAIFSYELLHKKHPEIQSVILVTSDYHIPWGAVLFQTKFLLAGSDLRIVSNVALNTGNISRYPIENYQRSGILQIAGLT